MNTVIWIRNNSNGESKLLQSTSVDIVYPLNATFSYLSDSPPADKFPYSYQCVVIGLCCEKLRSKYKTVDLFGSTVSPSTGGLASSSTTKNYSESLGSNRAKPTTVPKVPYNTTKRLLYTTTTTNTTTASPVGKSEILFSCTD